MIIPCTMHFAVLIAIEAPGEPIDYALEPIIAWSVTESDPPNPITVRGEHLFKPPIMRPDESVRYKGVDYPDFATFLHAMREPFGVQVQFESSEPVGPNASKPVLELQTPGRP